jgi:hypothetical protein
MKKLFKRVMTKRSLTTITRYLRRVLTAFSVLLNVLCGGQSGQTISASNWARKKKCKFNIVWLLDLIFLPLETDHCAHAWVLWEVRRMKCLQ